MHSKFNLKPMSVGGILDLAFKIYRGNFVAIILYSLLIGGVSSLVVSLLNAGPSLFAPSTLFSILAQGGSSEQLLYALSQYANTGGGMLASIANMAVSVLVTPFVTGGIIIIALGACYGERYDRSNALKSVKGMGGKLIGTNLALSVCLLGVLIVFIIVIFFVGTVAIGAGASLILFVVMWLMLIVALITVIMPLSAFYFPVAIHEQRFGFRAFSRSIRLFFSKFWRSLGVTLLSGIIVSVLQWAVGAVLAFLPNIFYVIGTTLLNSLLTPVTLIVMVVLYLDVRMRTEGLDLEIQAAGLDDAAGNMFAREQAFAGNSYTNPQVGTADAPKFYIPTEAEEKQE